MVISDVDRLPPMPNGKKRDKTDYMYRPPAIRPNYGKIKESLLPKTKMSRVLLFENNMQDNVLNYKLKYIANERKSYQFAFRKNKYAFIDKQNHRRKYHEFWEHGYNKLKNAFIAKYGRLYTPEPEIDPFYINARLAPPINVLCFYLDSQQKDLAGEKQDLRPSHPHGKQKASMTEYLLDHERLIGHKGARVDLYPRSVEDPRFRNLADTLVAPGFETMGYLQLSPTFHNVDANLPKKPRLELRHRDIALPNFYSRRNISSQDSSRSSAPSRRPSFQKDSTFPYVEDKRSSFSELSDRRSEVTLVE